MKLGIYVFFVSLVCGMLCATAFPPSAHPYMDHYVRNAVALDAADFTLFAHCQLQGWNEDEAYLAVSVFDSTVKERVQ